MDESNIAALLAFYNLLAAKIGLEDCKSLKDVRNLLPILANYMKVGVPNFVVDPNFGFRNAIALIALELDEEFQSQLNAEAAESGDVFEATKIHMAMIYTFRLLQTEAFSTICEQLEDTHQRRFAHVIECLDDRHRWSLVPWPKLLNTDSSQQLRTEDSDEDKENGVEVERLHRKSFNFAHTPKPCPARKLVLFPCGNSPIHKVVTSPRGHEVVRIHALEREVKSLREIRDLFGREKDKAEELCLKREQENNNLLKTNESLKSRLDRVLPFADQHPFLEGNLTSAQEQIGSLARSLKEAQTTGANAQERVLTLQFELDELEIKHGELQEKHDRVVRKAEDESKKAQQELLKLEEQNDQQKSKILELRTRLKDQESNSNRQYDQKVEEIALLQNELQELKFRNEAQPAGQGNSLFAEVIDGKDRLEMQLASLYKQNGLLRRNLESEKEKVAEYARLFESSNSKTLSGPTLDVLLVLKSDQEEWLCEKQTLVDRLHAVEESERGHARQWAKECPADYQIFQENLHTMHMHAKQKSEKRLLKLELRENELLRALAFERQRALSVPQLEQRIAYLERKLSHECKL